MVSATWRFASAYGKRDKGNSSCTDRNVGRLSYRESNPGKEIRGDYKIRKRKGKGTRAKVTLVG